MQKQKEQFKKQITPEEIAKSLHRIEQSVKDALAGITKQLAGFEEQNFLLRYGTIGFREKIVESYRKKEQYNPLDALLKTIQANPDLRFPHRKILEYLSQQYDYAKKKYVEMHMSKIVKECRLGKNRAKQYLDYLESKGLLQRRADGYRVWYRISAS